MMQTDKPWRLLAGMLGILAVFGLLLRAQAVPVPAAAYVFYGTLCHTGETDRPGPGRPATDCDACVLCQAVHSDHGGIPALPARFVLQAPADRIEPPSVRPAAADLPDRHLAGFHARAPPASA
jgi:hypothetical protein